MTVSALSTDARFAGKVAIITGAAQGIGAAVARGFIAEGGAALLADVRAEQLASLARALGERAAPFMLDVTDAAGWDAAVAEVVRRFGPLTHLFNIAGISESAHIENAAPDHWSRIMAINLTGPYLGCRAAVPAMAAGGQQGCAIVNIGSMLGLRPTAAFVAYSASKAGVAALTKSVALHCAAAGYPIRVNAVHPGATLTPMVSDVLDGMAGDRGSNAARFAEKLPMKRLGTAQEVTDAVLFLASDAAAFITAADLPVDGGGAHRE